MFPFFNYIAMKKLIALTLVASIITGCATVPSGSYDVGQSQNGRQDTTAQSGRQDNSNVPYRTNSSWNGYTIFWIVVGILAVGAAAKAAKKSGDNTCYTGPRGGTYTVTANGNKNYSGC